MVSENEEEGFLKSLQEIEKAVIKNVDNAVRLHRQSAEMLEEAKKIRAVVSYLVQECGHKQSSPPEGHH